MNTRRQTKPYLKKITSKGSKTELEILYKKSRQLFEISMEVGTLIVITTKLIKLSFFISQLLSG